MNGQFGCLSLLNNLVLLLRYLWVQLTLGLDRLKHLRGFSRDSRYIVGPDPAVLAHPVL